MTRRAALLVLVLACAGAAFGNYHFIHYTTSASPYGKAPEKFDLSALPDSTLQYVISQKVPILGKSDSFPALVSQIQMAASTWSDVRTSALRLQFGGFAAPTPTVQAVPGLDVLFGEWELPPGVVAMGGPTTFSAMVQTEKGSFVPIVRSVLVLGRVAMDGFLGMLRASGRSAPRGLALMAIKKMYMKIAPSISSASRATE